MNPSGSTKMDEQEILEQRYRFFADRGATLAFEQDKTLVTLFTGIVASLLALLAQMCYVGQLTCLFWAVAFAALGVLSLVWHVVGWTGLVVGSIFVAGLIVSVFRPLVTIYRLSRLALEKQAQEQNVQQQ